MPSESLVQLLSVCDISLISNAHSPSVFKTALPMKVEPPKRPERPVKTGLSGLEDVAFAIAPMRPPLARTEPTTNEEQRQYDLRAYDTPRTNMNGFFGAEEDPSVVIASQKQTIARLLEEVGYKNRALENLRNVEKSEVLCTCGLRYVLNTTTAFYRTENLLIAERRTAAQLRDYINQMEIDLKAQTDLANELLVINKETEVRFKMQVSE